MWNKWKNEVGLRPLKSTWVESTFLQKLEVAHDVGQRTSLNEKHK